MNDERIADYLDWIDRETVAQDEGELVLLPA